MLKVEAAETLLQGRDRRCKDVNRPGRRGGQHDLELHVVNASATADNIVCRRRALFCLMRCH